MQISASIYSNKERPLEELVKELDRYRVDYFHIDCRDDLSVFDDIERIRKVSKTPIDLHIISAHPEKYFDQIARTHTEMVSFQYENLTQPVSLPKNKFNGTRFGLAMLASTDPDVFDEYRRDFSFVLFMATSPGISGGTFSRENFARVRHLRSLFPNSRIHVDGGVNDEISFVLRSMGISLIVSGNYLVNADYIGAALHNLKSDNVNSHIRVKDFMIGLKESPVLQRNNFTFHQALTSIEVFNMGFTIVTESDGKLAGIITNADVRRGLLKNATNLNLVDPAAILNTQPVTVNENQTVSELLLKLKSLSFPVLFLPVIDDQGKLTGTLTFNNLIRGES